MDTYGWDFVCACSCDRLNTLLALQFTATPTKIAFDDNNGTTINATFAPWRIIGGGGGTKLHIEMPISTGSVTTQDMGAPVTATIDHVVVVAEIDLAFLSDPASSKNNLKFNFKSIASKLGDPTAGAIYVVTPDRDGILPKSGPIWMTLHDCLPKWLIANNDKLAYIFTSLNLAPTGDAAWLTPYNPKYFKVEGATGSAGYLVIVGMITAADTSQLQADIDPALCDGTSDICMAFAPQVFLEHMVKPNLPAAFPGSTAANFLMQGDEIVSFLPLMCPPVRYGLIDYYPALATLSITIAGANLVASGVGGFDITGLTNSSVSFSETAKLKCNFDSASQTLKLVADGTPVTDHETHVPWWIYVVAAPTLLIVGPVVLVIVDAVIGAVTAAVASSVTTSTGKLSLSNWSASVLDFPGATSWTTQQADLSSAFYMRCTIHS